MKAEKVPKFHIGGTLKSPPKNLSTTHCSDAKSLPPPSSEPSKKRPADDQVASTKRHKPEDPLAGVRASPCGPSIDQNWSYHYRGNTVLFSSNRLAAAQLLRKVSGPPCSLPELNNLEDPEAYEVVARDIARVCFFIPSVFIAERFNPKILSTYEILFTR